MSSKSRRQQSEEAENNGTGNRLTASVKTLLTLMELIPAVALFFYATGMWEVKIENGIAIRDDLDDVLYIAAIIIAIFATIILHVLIPTTKE